MVEIEPMFELLTPPQGVQGKVDPEHPPVAYRKEHRQIPRATTGIQHLHPKRDLVVEHFCVQPLLRLFYQIEWVVEFFVTGKRPLFVKLPYTPRNLFGLALPIGAPLHRAYCNRC